MSGTQEQPAHGSGPVQIDFGERPRRNPLDAHLLYRESNIPRWRFVFLCTGIGLGLFMAMMDASIVATSLVTIGHELGDLESINWVALAYTLAFLGCSVFFARIADVVGRRNAFMAAFVIFISFSLGCGFSPNMTSLIACRAFQGIGGAGLFSVTMIIFPEVTPRTYKDMIASVIGLVISMSGILGPILGGVFTQYASWRWIFWVNAPLGFMAMSIFYFTWPKADRLPPIERRSWRDMDFLGSFLVIAAAVLVTFSFQNAGADGTNVHPWREAVFIVPLVVGIVCWVAVFAWEFVSERLWPRRMPALPLVFVRNHVFAASTLNTIFLGFSYLATLFAVPLRLQVVNQKSAIMAGVMMLPMLGATGVGSALAGMMSKKQNRLFETMMVATISVTLGLALETTVSDSQELEPKFLGFLVFIGLGYGMVTASATIFSNIESPISEHAPAQGIIAQARMLGGSIGIAMSSAILASQQQAQLAGIVPASVLGDMNSETLNDAQMVAIRRTYNDAFTETMKICAIVAGIGVLLTTGTFRRDRLPLHQQRDKQVQEEVVRREALLVKEMSQMASSNSSGRSA